jgi:hypothetical protein
MAHQRSPNCPQITFLEAADKGRMVYMREHTHPAAKEVIAESLGYSGLNGRSLSMIGALRQYGILEGTGDALRITDDAVTYFELEDGDERNSALSRLLFHPPFFEQIRAEFGDMLPSEPNLKHYLIKQGFLPKAAESVIRIYRENIRLVENTAKRYSEDQYVGVEPMPMSGSALVSSASKPPIEVLQTVEPTWSQTYSFPLSKETRAELNIRGNVTKEALALLRDHIELTIRALTADTKDDKEPSN